MRCLLVLVAAAAFAVGGAAAAPPPHGIVHVQVPPGTPLRELGYQLYAANCISCHGVDGRGVSPPAPSRGAGHITGAGPPLRGVGALAADFYLRTGYMPLGSVDTQPWRGTVLFSDREINALVAYVASLGNGPAIPTVHPDRGSLSEGLRLFTEHCAGCHQVVARGGYLTGARVPPLDEATPRQIVEAVRIGPYLMPRFSRNAVSDRELDSIVRYVEHSRHPTDRGGWGIGHLGPIPEGMVTWFVAALVLVALCVVFVRKLSDE